MTTKLYSVSGNMDQIKKQEMDKSYQWIASSKQLNADRPNRYYTLLPIEQARELYRVMEERNMVAFRNWVDLTY